MKAVRVHARGGPEQLVVEEAPEPLPGDRDALVRVFACAITPTELSWSASYTARDGSSRLPAIPGHELSGRVVATGADAPDVRVGDKVYALTDFWRDGAAAEFTVVVAADLAPKPQSLDDVQAAAVPLSGLTAWQALFDHAGLAPGQRILIHGAAGGVGSFAVQLARWRGAYVIGTARAANHDLVRRLGADEVIDYTAVRFEDRVRDLDAVLDTIGGETRERSLGVLRGGGVLVTVAGNAPAENGEKYGVRTVFFIVTPNRAQLIEIGKLIDEGQITPVIEDVVPLEDARAAFVRGSRGHNTGKLVLRVARETAAGD